MYMKTSLLQLSITFFVLLTVTILPQVSMGQNASDSEKNKTSESTGPKRFWQASLPGGSYIVALDRITSISQHSYLVDGNISVTEVVIDTSGNSLARFYYLEPVAQNTSNVGAQLSQRGKDLLNKVGQRTGIDTNSAVIKQYPATTHAKTVEFHITNVSTLDALLNSARGAWINGKGKKFIIDTGR